MIAAAGLVSGGVAAQAADLGGNCCADLEEACLLRTRSNHRPQGQSSMSLQIYGWVNRALVWHDDDFAATAPHMSIQR